MEDMVRRLGEVLWKQMGLPARHNVIAVLVIGETYHHLLEMKLVSSRKPGLDFDKGAVSERYVAELFNSLHSNEGFDKHDPTYRSIEAFGKFAVSKTTLIRKFMYLMSNEDADWLKADRFHIQPPEDPGVLALVRDLIFSTGSQEGVSLIVSDGQPYYHGFACLYVQVISYLMEKIHGRNGLYTNHATEAAEYRKRYDSWNKKNGEGNSKHDKICLGISKPKAAKAATEPEVILLPDVGGPQPADSDSISDPDFETFYSQEEQEVMKYGATLKTVEFLELQVIARATKAASLYALRIEDPLGGMEEVKRLADLRSVLRERLYKIKADTAME